MKKIDYTKIAIICLQINIIIVSIAIFQMIFGWNLFEKLLQSFAWAIILSYAIFSLCIFLISFLNEINGIRKALNKISEKL